MKRRHQRYRPRPKKPYVPRFRLGGVLVPVAIMRQEPWSAAKTRRLRDIEQWFVAEFKNGHRGCASLRRFPVDLWNDLQDLLPLCYCGRKAPPKRAMASRRANEPTVYCSDRCSDRASGRRWLARQLAAFTRKREERRAIAESLYQMGDV